MNSVLEGCYSLSSTEEEHSFNWILIQLQGLSQILGKGDLLYGSQTNQTVYYLPGYPLWMDHCHPSGWTQIIS